MKQLLSNPIWNALTTVHVGFCHRQGEVIRYQKEVAPFCAVPNSEVIIDPEVLLQQGDIYFVGVLPRLKDGAYHVRKGSILQMIYQDDALPAELPRQDQETELTIENAAEMVELTQLAFPGYFRQQTPLMGKYLGIRIDGLLVAMAGERMRLPGLVEISGVCTRPGYTGRGYATYLVQRLLQSQTEEKPFLHVGSTNTRAIEIYQNIGFKIFNEVELLHLSSVV